MKKAKAQTVRDLVKSECERQDRPFLKGMYRRAKKEYNKLSWIQKTKVV